MSAFCVSFRNLRLPEQIFSEAQILNYRIFIILSLFVSWENVILTSREASDLRSRSLKIIHISDYWLILQYQCLKKITSKYDLPSFVQHDWLQSRLTWPLLINALLWISRDILHCAIRFAANAIHVGCQSVLMVKGKRCWVFKSISDSIYWKITSLHWFEYV